MAELPPLFSGFDKFNLPFSPHTNGLDWMAVFLQRSAFRVVGAYLYEEEQRHWHSAMRALIDRGWGVAPVFAGLSHNFFQIKKPNPATGKKEVVGFDTAKWLSRMTPERGTSDARYARELAMTAGILPGSVVWFDNEDSDDVTFAPQDLAYYAAFITELTDPADRDAPPYQCGLYAHQEIAAQLLYHHPELWIWEVDYGDRQIGVGTLPTLRTPTREDSRFGLDPTAKDVTVKAFRVLPPRGGTGPGWVSWPVWRQWQGNNDVTFPPQALGAAARVPPKWDWNSSLVRDPADPQPTPRLAAGTTGPSWLARLDDLDPVFDSTERRVQTPRRGGLTVQPARGEAIDVTCADGYLLHPGSDIVPLNMANGATQIVVRSTLGDLGSTLFQDRTCTPVTPLWVQQIRPGLRRPFAVAGCVAGSYAHLFWAADDRRLWCARHDGVHIWEDHLRAGGNLRLHPLAQVAAAELGGRSHVVTEAADGRLTHVPISQAPTEWPPPQSTPMSDQQTVPGGPLAVADGGEGTLVAVAVGRQDMRLRVWTLRPGKPAARWSGPLVLGEPEDSVHPKTRIGVFRPAPGHLLVSAVSGPGRILRFLLTAATGWGSPRPRAVTIPDNIGRPHPYTDLPTLTDGRLAFASVLPHRPGVLVTGSDGYGVPK